LAISNFNFSEFYQLMRLCKIHLELCICNSNPTVETINKFAEVGSSILNNFGKISIKNFSLSLSFLAKPFGNYFVSNISHSYGTYFFWLIRKIMGGGKNSCPAQSAPLNECRHVSKLSQNVVYHQPFFLLVNFCQNEKLKKKIK